MRRTNEHSIRLIKARCVIDLMQDMTKKKIGRTSLGRQCQSICRGLPISRKNTIVNRVMRWKLNDAKARMRRAQYLNTNEWRRSKHVIAAAGILQDFETIWSDEKSRIYRVLREKRKRKVAFLKQKQKRTKEIPDEIEGHVRLQCSYPYYVLTRTSTSFPILLSLLVLLPLPYYYVLILRTIFTYSMSLYLYYCILIPT